MSLVKFVGGRIGASLLAGLIASGLALGLPGLARAAVVIHEVHYHPPAPYGKALEFIELHNDDPAVAISIEGWRFVAGIEFEFPAGAAIPAGGYAIVCRDRDELMAVFGLPERGVFGNWAGALDNDGDRLRLVDAFGAHIDGLRYDDRAPWPDAGPDAGGSSLQRLCTSAPAEFPENWTGDVGQLPTPMQENAASRCPLPAWTVPPVVINEIYYHPLDDRDELEEYVEILNTTDEAIDLSGWRLAGAAFDFPAGTTIGGGEYLVVCRNEDHVRTTFGIDNTVGDFTGELSNRGERLALETTLGEVVDIVNYSDHGDWSFAADGDGRSLERISPTARSDDPASWSNSLIEPGDFVSVSLVGTLGNLLTQKVVIGNNGAGEFIIDDVALEAVDSPDVGLVPNGGFEEGLGSWNPRGNAAASVVEAGVGVGGSAGLRVLTAGECGADCESCSSRNSVEYRWRTEDLDIEASYRLTFQYRYVGGSPSFYCRVLGGVSFCFGANLFSPGVVNSNLSAVLPPFVSDRGRFPQEPTSSDSTWISARVRTPSGQEIESVRLTSVVGDVTTTVDMHDDGAHADAAANDGIWGVDLPPYPHDTAVLYRVAARTVDGGEAVAPLTPRPRQLVNGDLWGYYVYDDAPDSVLPIYHVLVPGVDPSRPTAINARLNCNALTTASFAYRGELWPDIGLRFRGNTACILTKRNLKVRFNKGRWFRDVRKINLQGIWTDKSLVREQLAWDFIRQLGGPYCETEFIRVHLNGQYHGLFLYLEHPDERYLRRNGLNANGGLYKARQPSGAGQPRGVEEQESPGAYARFWEEETLKRSDFTGVAEFIGSLHADGRAAGGPTAEFFLDRCYPRELIAYQLAQSVLNNIDSFAKNHFLYWNTDNDRWSLHTWDMDLVFGKNFDPAVQPVGTINDCMLSPNNDLNPWFTTTVNGNFLLHYYVDFFMRAGDGYFQRAYLVRLWDLLEEKYRNEVYDEILADWEALLAEESEEDFARWGRSPVNCPRCPASNCANQQDMVGNLVEVSRQIELHREFLRRYIQRWHRDVPDHDRMKITEVMFNPIGASSDLEFLEITNISGREIDIGGWQLTDGIQYTFPPGTTVQEDGVVIVAKSRPVFLAQYPLVPRVAQVLGEYGGRLGNDGDTIRLIDAGGTDGRGGGEGYPATIDLLAYGDGGEWPDVRPGHSIELMNVTPERDNDDPRNWESSDAPLGTPGGEIPEGADFLRGDANADDEINLSDAVSILQYLFQGGVEPDCEDAADADDDGEIVLTDAVYVLGFLFAQGAPPPPPYPEPGTDPTDDELTCE